MTGGEDENRGVITCRLAGWGRYPAATGRVARPDRLHDLAELTRGAGPLVARGLGRSYGDASFSSSGCTVLTGLLNRMLSFDEPTGVVECEPGVTIADLIECFLPRGFLPPVLPGTKFVTVGGAIACDIHGKNHHRDGSWSRHVLDFDLLTASGDTLRCSRTEHPEAFWATVGGMGLTGIVTRLRMKLDRVEGGYVAVDYRRCRGVDEVLDLFDASDHDYKYSVAWIDCATRARVGRGVLMRANHVPGDDGPVWRSRKPRHFPAWIPRLLLGRWSTGLFNAMYYRRHPTRSRPTSVEYERYFFPLDKLEGWNRFYGPSGFFQHQCVIPSRDGLQHILQRFSAAPGGVFLAVLKRFGAAESDQLLSFPMPGYTLAVDLPNRGRRTLDFLTDIDSMVIASGGRVYLAKDARLSAKSVAAMYPRLDEWRTIRNKLDPDGWFSSDLGRRLGLVS